jgi:hypothetical protein
MTDDFAILIVALKNIFPFKFKRKKLFPSFSDDDFILYERGTRSVNFKKIEESY